MDRMDFATSFGSKACLEHVEDRKEKSDATAEAGYTTAADPLPGAPMFLALLGGATWRGTPRSARKAIYLSPLDKREESIYALLAIKPCTSIVVQFTNEIIRYAGPVESSCKSPCRTVLQSWALNRQTSLLPTGLNMMFRAADSDFLFSRSNADAAGINEF